MATVNIKGVEIARTGTFDFSTGRGSFTAGDFDDMAAASAQLRGVLNAPLKLGHGDDQKILQSGGLPAAGWIENVRRVGSTLVADFMKVPEAIAKLVTSGAYRSRSVEAFRNVTFGTTRYRMVLTGVALLGADLPAVDSLKDISSLYGSVSISPEDAEHITAEISGAGKVAQGEENMDEKLKKLLASLLDIEEGDLEDDKKVEAAVTTFKASRDKTAVSLSDLSEEDRKALVDEVKAAMEPDPGNTDPNNKDGDAKDKAIEMLTEEVNKLKASHAADQAEAAVDAAIKAGKFIPAARDSMLVIAKANIEAFNEMAKNTPDNSAVDTTTNGTATGGEADATDLEGVMAKYGPSAESLKIMADIGVSKEEYVLQAIDDDPDAKVPEAVMAALREKAEPKKED